MTKIAEKFRSAPLVPDESMLLEAIERALATVRRTAAGGLVRQDGRPAATDLGRLASELERLRDDVRLTGTIDPTWITRAVRDAVRWLPESDIVVLAALGGVARAASSVRPRST